MGSTKADKVNTTDVLRVSAEKKRLLQEITHLEKAQKSGIVSKAEVASAKVGIDKKIRVLEHKEKQVIAKNKAVEEILGASLHVAKQSSQKKVVDKQIESSKEPSNIHKETPRVEIVDLPEPDLYTPSSAPSGKRHNKYFAPLTISKQISPKIERKEHKEQKIHKEHKISHSKEERKEQPAHQETRQQRENAVDKHKMPPAVQDISGFPSSFPASPQPEYQAIDELVEEDDTNWRFALAVLTIFLLILLYIKFTSYGAPGDVMTVDAYLDYASPYSRDMHAVLVALQSEYGEKLWVEYHLVGTTDFHTLAASAVSCADAQQRKQEYLAYLFSTDETLVTAQEFTASAETLGLVSIDFAACLSAADSSAYLQQQQDYENAEILYTPTLIVNNKKIVGAVGYDAVKSVLDEQLLQLG